MARRKKVDPSLGLELHGAVRTVARWVMRADVGRGVKAIEGVTLSATDTWLLGALADLGPMRASDLAAWQGVDKSTVTPQIRRLEEGGLVSRAVDPADRRAALLSLSAKGKRVLRKYRTRGASQLADHLADWDEADRRDLVRLIGRLAAELDETYSPPDGSA